MDSLLSATRCLRSPSLGRVKQPRWQPWVPSLASAKGCVCSPCLPLGTLGSCVLPFAALLGFRSRGRGVAGGGLRRREGGSEHRGRFVECRRAAGALSRKMAAPVAPSRCPQPSWLRAGSPEPWELVRSGSAGVARPCGRQLHGSARSFNAPRRAGSRRFDLKEVHPGAVPVPAGCSHQGARLAVCHHVCEALRSSRFRRECQGMDARAYRARLEASVPLGLSFSGESELRSDENPCPEGQKNHYPSGLEASYTIVGKARL